LASSKLRGRKYRLPTSCFSSVVNVLIFFKKALGVVLVVVVVVVVDYSSGCGIANHGYLQ
jgi:hypothetical protein